MVEHLGAVVTQLNVQPVVHANGSPLTGVGLEEGEEQEALCLRVSVGEPSRVLHFLGHLICRWNFEFSVFIAIRESTVSHGIRVQPNTDPASSKSSNEVAWSSSDNQSVSC